MIKKIYNLNILITEQDFLLAIFLDINVIIIFKALLLLFYFKILNNLK
jgi:hypothetical protein